MEIPNIQPPFSFMRSRYTEMKVFRRNKCVKNVCRSGFPGPSAGQLAGNGPSSDTDAFYETTQRFPVCFLRRRPRRSSLGHPPGTTRPADGERTQRAGERNAPDALPPPPPPASPLA